MGTHCLEARSSQKSYFPPSIITMTFTLLHIFIIQAVNCVKYSSIQTPADFPVHKKTCLIIARCSLGHVRFMVFRGALCFESAFSPNGITFRTLSEHPKVDSSYLECLQHNIIITSIETGNNSRIE